MAVRKKCVARKSTIDLDRRFLLLPTHEKKKKKKRRNRRRRRRRRFFSFCDELAITIVGGGPHINVIIWGLNKNESTAAFYERREQGELYNHS
jgi:hypothetical protein